MEALQKALGWGDLVQGIDVKAPTLRGLGGTVAWLVSAANYCEAVVPRRYEGVPQTWTGG